MSCLTDTVSLIRWKKLAPWWPDRSHDLRSRNSENWPQGNRETWTLNWRLTVPETIKMMLVRHRWPVSGWWSELTVLFLHVAPPSSIKLLPPDCQRGESAFGQMSTLLPPGTGTQQKANFAFHQPGLFIVFGAVSRQIPLLVTGWERKTCLVNKILSRMIKALLYTWKKLFV